MLAAEGVNVRLETELVDDESSVCAWTDWERIHIGYHMYDDIATLSAILRGLSYHEGGHIVHTLPFKELIAAVAEGRGCFDSEVPLFNNDIYAMHHAWNVLEDQRMETAVVSASPRKAGYFAPMILAEFCPDLDSTAANYPTLAWRKYLPSKVRQGARKLFVLKHGDRGEELASRIEDCITRYVTGTDAETLYQATFDMAEVLQKIQPMAVRIDNYAMGHQAMKEKVEEPYDPNVLSIPIDPSMMEEPFAPCDDETDEPEAEPEIDTTDPDVAEHLAEILRHMFLDPWNLIRVQHVLNMVVESEETEESEGPPPSSTDDEAEPQPASGDESDEDETEEIDTDVEGTPDEGDASKDEADESEGGGGNSEEEADDSEEAPSGGDGSDDEGDEIEDIEYDDEADGGSGGGDFEDDEEGDESDESMSGDGNGASNDSPADELTEDDLKAERERAEEDRLKDPAIQRDVDAYHDAMDNMASTFAPYQAGVSTDAAAKAEAAGLANDIENAFHAATVMKAPAWREQQRHGIVNVLRYKTRQPGEHDFFKAYVDNGRPGFDLAVSILLDNSGSMENCVEELAKVAYASKLACQNLEIPCTVILWNTDAETLYDATELVENLPVVYDGGGTDPTKALTDLENQRFGKAKHIVIVMTDGVWNPNAPSVAPYSNDGRLMIGLGFDSKYRGVDQDMNAILSSLESKGFDSVLPINTLSELPWHLEQALIDNA